MPIHCESNVQSCLIRIDGEMTISNAGALKNGLMEIITKKCPVIEIDLSGVDAIDTSGVQILILLKRETQGANITMRLTAMSDPVRSALRLFNIQELLR